MTKKLTCNTLKNRVVELEQAYKLEKQAEEALRESEKRYRAVVEDLPAMVCRFLPDGTLTFVNSFVCSYYLKYKEDLLGHNFFELFPDDVAAELRQHLALLSIDAPTVVFEEEVPRPDDTTRWQEWTNRALYDEAGNLVEFQSIGRDITRQKRALEESAKLERQRQQAQKIEAVSTLASGIAHDFNNILAAVIGHSELAQLYLPADSMARQDLKKILNAAYRARDLVNLIQTISLEHQAQQKPIQIVSVVQQAVELFRPTLLENIELVLQIETDSAAVQCDPSHLQQAVTNLCTNAQYAMREFGGVLTVTLKTKTLSASAAAQFADLEPGDYVQLTVSDTGHGIDQETIRRIFDPYFTTKEKDVGTGLGLAVVYGIVRNYGGTIEVTSKQGQGTTFTVFLPSLDIPETGPNM